MDYAQSRLQARLGRFPDERLWHAIEAAHSSAAALEIARASGWKPRLAGIAPHATQHEIEIALRAQWRECIAEITTWMPGNWQPALLWLRDLADFPAVLHLARGAAPLPWMTADPVLQAYVGADAAAGAERARRDCCAFTGLSPDALDAAMAPAAGPSPMGQACLAEWRRRWPRHGDTAAMEAFARLVDATLQQATPLDRPALGHALRRLFRRSVLDPVVAFIYIAFLALKLERLRTALLGQRLAQEGIKAS